MEVDYIDDAICISKFPLSASVCLSKITNVFEEYWDII
jgi:rRNA pseudouridine-1189 N-methylase Emg1 (Nep1/Mra1 family)